MSKTCLIMRGAPGSGKTTWLNRYRRHARVYSADAYRMVNGVYLYDASRDQEVHDRCVREFLQAVVNNLHNDVAVDNTNVKVWEIAPYYRAAEALGYDTRVVWLVADPEECVRRNLHGVPPARVRAMSRAFEPLPSFWKVELVFNNY